MQVCCDACCAGSSSTLSLTTRAELRVASLALVIPDGATVGLHWAAWAYGADTFPPGRRTDLRPTVVVRHGGTRLKGDRFLVRQTKFPDGEPVESDGVLLTSPARTASDLLRLAWRPHAMAAGDAILRAKVVSHEAVMDEVRRYSRVPGAKQAMELAPRLDARANKHGEKLDPLQDPGRGPSCSCPRSPGAAGPAQVLPRHDVPGAARRVRVRRARAP